MTLMSDPFIACMPRFFYQSHYSTFNSLALDAIRHRTKVKRAPYFTKSARLQSLEGLLQRVVLTFLRTKKIFASFYYSRLSILRQN